MTEDRSPLTPQQIRDGLSNNARIARDLFGDEPEARLNESAIALLDSQALALTQQQQLIAHLRQSIAAEREAWVALIAERDTLKKERDTLQVQLHDAWDEA